MNDMKAQLRERLKGARDAMPAAEREAADTAIRDRVLALPEFHEADAVLTYLSFGSEVDTRGIIEEAWGLGKTVALPRCTAPHEMRWFRVASFDGLERSKFGVEEPPLDPATEFHPESAARAIALVPGLAFDAEGYRLGYGGGYYDAFLATFTGTSIGLCRPEQRLESLAAAGALDPHDRPVDVLV